MPGYLRFARRVAFAMLLACAWSIQSAEPKLIKRWQYEALHRALQDPDKATREQALDWLGEHAHPDRPENIPAELRDLLTARVANNDANAVALIDIAVKLGSGLAQSVPAIAARLAHDDPHVREHAAGALGQMGLAAAPAAGALVHLLRDEDAKDAAASAIAELAKAGVPVADAVARLLRDGDDRVRDTAVSSLGQMGSAAAPYASALAKRLEDPQEYWDVRANSAKALASLGPAGEPYAPVIAAQLNDQFSAVRSAAAEALGKMGAAGAKYARAVAALLKDRFWLTRQIAAEALEEMGAPARQYAAAIATLLKDEHEDVRAAAAGILLRMGPTGGPYVREVEAILASGYLRNNQFQYALDASSREPAGRQLSNLGPIGARVAPATAALLSSKDPRAREEAVRVLGNIGPAGARYASAVVPLLKDPIPGVRGAAANALGSMGVDDAQVASAVGALLSDSEPGTRAAAASAIGDMKAAGAVYTTALARLAADPSEDVRSAAGQAIGRLGIAAAPAASALATLLQDPNTTVRRHAVIALSALGPAASQYVHAMAALLQPQDDEYLRRDVLRTLTRMGVAAAPAAPAVAALLDHKDEYVRDLAVTALAAMGPAGTQYAPDIAALLESGSMMTPQTAAQALGSMGAAGVAHAHAVAMLLLNRDGEFDVDDVNQVARDLQRLSTEAGPIGTPKMLAVCLEGWLKNPDELARVRLACHLLGGASPAERLLMQIVNRPDRPAPPVRSSSGDDGSLELLQQLANLWPAVNQLGAAAAPLTPGVRAATADLMRDTARSHAAQFGLLDLWLLEALIERLDAADLPGHAAVLREVRDRMKYYEWVKNALRVLLLHAAIWIVLIAIYPRSRFVQALFFWNRWMRRFLGLGYVSALITVVPFLRKRMFIPFRESLVQQGSLVGHDEHWYFAECDVLEASPNGSSIRRPLPEAMPDVGGQVLLRGESGLGKSTLLSHLALSSERIVVLLRASECDKGVMPAIQNRLQGQVRDRSYLSSLIHAGALEVLIDGLNEAPPAARSRIVQFVEEFFRGNFVLATQPIEMPPPRTARVLTLLPLRSDQIQEFLIKQWARVAPTALVTELAYERIVTDYVAHVLGAGESDARLRVLSHPMEASLVADFLSRKQHPDLLRLIEQRFAVMADDFVQGEGRPFPYDRFAERVYEWRISGASYFDITAFDAEVATLVRHKLMVCWDSKAYEASGLRRVTRWRFRHEKFMDWALLPAFMGAHASRRLQHITVELFFGVYELLATKLADHDDRVLFEHLVQQAADTKSNELLNRYTIARRGRQQAA